MSNESITDNGAHVITPLQNNFNDYLQYLKGELNYVQDSTFSWDKVTAILVIPLSNTDSINKTNPKSNATNIVITGSKDATSGQSRTEDFFPSLNINSTFPRWRLEVKARMNRGNIEVLKGNDPAGHNQWINDRIEVKHRPDLNEGQNPVIHICYTGNLRELREQLWPKDYLIIVKQKKLTIYEAFGLKSSAPLGRDKQLFVSPGVAQDISTFGLNEISNKSVVVQSNIEDESNIQLELNEITTSLNDEIWIFNSDIKAITHQLKVIDRIGVGKFSCRLINKILPPLSLDPMCEITSLRGLCEYLLEIIKQSEES